MITYVPCGNLYTVPVKVTAVVGVPLHSVWLAIAPTVGVGLTVMVKLCAAPMQPLADGVTVIIAAAGVVVVLVAVNDAIFPVPVDARPMLVFVFDQV